MKVPLILLALTMSANIAHAETYRLTGQGIMCDNFDALIIVYRHKTDTAEDTGKLIDAYQQHCIHATDIQRSAGMSVQILQKDLPYGFVKILMGGLTGGLYTMYVDPKVGVITIK